jgi:chromosome partitioning protein
MLTQPGARRAPHIIVIGNEKGGTGKSTLAMHLTVALLNFGQRVGTIDLDSRQQTFTHYIKNRQSWAKRATVKLRLPEHFCVAAGSSRKLDDNEAIEFARFADAVANVERTFDFLVIDAPGANTYLARLAHSMADTLITPLNDSFIDLAVLGTIDPASFAVTGESHYAQMVRETRMQRRMVDGGLMDWVVMRNRMSLLGSGNKERISSGLLELATRLGFRIADGLAERTVYREFFPRGLTAFDDLEDHTPGVRPSLSHVAARQEVLTLINMLKLPFDQRGQERAAAQAKWLATRNEPLELHDIIAE